MSTRSGCRSTTGSRNEDGAERQATVDAGVSLGSFNPGAGSSKDWLGSGYDFDAPNGFTVAGSLDLGGSFGTCEDTCVFQTTFGHSTPPNRPPAVQEHGANASGDEGSALVTHGSFGDPDGDPLTITGVGAGSVTDHGNGRWSWRNVPLDDGSGLVTVLTASWDLGTAAMVLRTVFSWRADNVPTPRRSHRARRPRSLTATLSSRPDRDRPGDRGHLHLVVRRGPWNAGGLIDDLQHGATPRAENVRARRDGGRRRRRLRFRRRPTPRAPPVAKALPCHRSGPQGPGPDRSGGPVKAPIGATRCLLGRPGSGHHAGSRG